MSEDRNETIRRAGGRLLRRHAPAHGAARKSHYWDDRFFGLDKVARFRHANATSQQAVLEDASRTLLAESWGIECTGIAFCARMTLLADTLDEQRLFSLVGADEAAHSTWIEPWLEQPARRLDAFGRFVTGLADAGSPDALAYLLQTVLEGFGITHYTGLAASCLDDELGAVLKRMAQDEALHHAAGLAAFHVGRLNDADRAFLKEGSAVFLTMIRSGPQSVAAALDRAAGIDGLADAERLFAEFDNAADTSAKLDRLRTLMTQPSMEWLVAELEEKDLFTPCTPAESARLYISARANRQ